MAFFVFVTFTALLASLTLLPLWRNEAWWVRGWDFPRLQLAILLAGCLTAQLFVLELSRPATMFLLAVTAACLLYQSWWIVPYTRLYPREVEQATERGGEDTIRIMVSNVLQPSRRAEALLRIVRESNPDVLVTLESDIWWQAKLDSLETQYPFALKCPQYNLYGMHVYSRLKLEESSIRFLVEPDVPSIHTVAVLASGRRVSLHFVHPSPPSPLETGASKERDAELLAVGRSVAKSKTPTIVTGDLNDVAWSETTRLFRKISGLLDPRVGRGMYNSFHARYWFARWPLDHFFHSSHFKLLKLRRLPKFGSDHFPMLIELAFGVGNDAKQEGLTASPADEARAAEKVEAQGVGSVNVNRLAATNGSC